MPPRDSFLREIRLRGVVIATAILSYIVETVFLIIAPKFGNVFIYTIITVSDLSLFIGAASETKLPIVIWGVVTILVVGLAIFSLIFKDLSLYGYIIYIYRIVFNTLIFPLVVDYVRRLYDWYCVRCLATNRSSFLSLRLWVYLCCGEIPVLTAVNQYFGLGNAEYMVIIRSAIIVSILLIGAKNQAAFLVLMHLIMLGISIIWDSNTLYNFVRLIFDFEIEEHSVAFVCFLTLYIYKIIFFWLVLSYYHTIGYCCSKCGRKMFSPTEG